MLETNIETKFLILYFKESLDNFIDLPPEDDDNDEQEEDEKHSKIIESEEFKKEDKYRIHNNSNSIRTTNPSNNLKSANDILKLERTVIRLPTYTNTQKENTLL